MKNFIILQIQHYRPTNANLKFVWNLLKGSQFYDVRKRIDPFFNKINSDSSWHMQEKVFFKSFRCIVSHFSVTTGEKRIRGIEEMKYETDEGRSSYKLLLSKRQIQYFSDVRRIQDITIRTVERHEGKLHI